MTLDSAAYAALRQFYAAAFRTCSVSDEYRAHRTVIVHDIMTALEPRNAEVGRLSAADARTLRERVARDLTDDELFPAASQTWLDYVEKRVARVRDLLAQPNIVQYVFKIVSFYRLVAQLWLLQGTQLTDGCSGRLKASLRKTLLYYGCLLLL